MCLIQTVDCYLESIILVLDVLSSGYAIEDGARCYKTFATSQQSMQLLRLLRPSCYLSL